MRLLPLLILAGVVGVTAGASGPIAANALSAANVPAKAARTVAPAVAAVAETAAATTGSVRVKIVEPPLRPPSTWTFEPKTVTVKVGAKVTWVNDGAVIHTVTADDGKAFGSVDIPAKGSFSFTPTAAGTFAYHCKYHPWMKGILIVQP